MVKSAPIVAALLAAPVAALSACATNQQPNQPSTSTSTSTATASQAPGTERLTTQLKSADGTPVANAVFEFANGFATITVETIGSHILTPGFHGMHIHSVGKCEPNSVAPSGGPTGDFDSAGGHYQVPGRTGFPASGDLTSLEVRSDGSAKLVTTTDAFTAADLLAGEKTALIIHQNPDNFGNIPSDRYNQKNGAPGPDEATLSTGDAGKRVACGVIGSATTTATTTAAPTSAGATTTAAPAPSGTERSTVTVTPPSVSLSPLPGPPNNPAQPGPR